MKHCNHCDVKIETNQTTCPLCGAALEGQGGEEVYPVVVTHQKYHFIKRLLLFLSVASAAVCVLINFLTTPDFWWWMIVVTVMVYAWSVVLHTRRRGGNIGGKILMQVVCGSVLAVLLDMEIGWQGWSANYVLPAIFSIGIVVIVIWVLCNRTNWASYVLYQVTLAILGFIPLVLYFLEVSQVFLFSAIPAVMAFLSFLILAFFGDRTIKNEFRRRLRF